MSFPAKKSVQEMRFDSITGEGDKPDTKVLDLGSPVSPLMTRSTATTPAGGINHGATSSTSSSSSSGGSVSGKVNSSQTAKKPENANSNHSGDLSGLSETLRSARISRPGHRRSISAGAPLIYSGKTISTASSNINAYAATANAPSSASSNPTSNGLPSGNILPPGKPLKSGMATRAQTRTDTLCSGTGHYGHGSIIRGGLKPGSSTKSGDSNADVKGSIHLAPESVLIKRAMVKSDPEEVKKCANELYMRGHYSQALVLYDRAISLAPQNAAYRGNRAAALTMLGRLDEAVPECEMAVRLDSAYERGHKRLASLYLRLGQVENARLHLFFRGQQPDQSELQKLNSLELHLKRCLDARKLGDWKVLLRESAAAMEIGADYCPQLAACRAEAFMKLHQLDEAESCLSYIPKIDQYPSSCSQTVFFGMLCEAYVFHVRAQVEMALGKFEDAVAAAEKAGLIDCSNIEISKMLYNVKMISRSRADGKKLFDAGKYDAACSAYGKGLTYDSSNHVLYCNRAVCWSKCENWEKCVEDCNKALRIQPTNIKALNLRAISYEKLGRFAEAAKDFEVLNRELPEDINIAEALSRMREARKKCRAEEGHNVKSETEVEQVSSIEKFKAVISSSGVSVVYFKEEFNELCDELSSFLNMLCVRYPSVRFFKVDVEESLLIAKSEFIKTVPTFKIYKEGNKVIELVRPSYQLLESSVKSSVL